MDMAMEVVGWSCFGLAVLLGLFLNLLGLFGNWIILGAMAVAFFVDDAQPFGWWGLGIGVVFAILGEVVETAFAGYGASKFGGSKGAIWASLVGVIVGAIVLTPLIPIPLFGTVVGGCAGAFLGAAIYEYVQHQKEIKEAMRVGWGAALGKIGGLMAKLICGIIILVVAFLTF